jgi:hypothetical protein
MHNGVRPAMQSESSENPTAAELAAANTAGVYSGPFAWPVGDDGLFAPPPPPARGISYAAPPWDQARRRGRWRRFFHAALLVLRGESRMK